MQSAEKDGEERKLMPEQSMQFLDAQVYIDQSSEVGEGT